MKKTRKSYHKKKINKLECLLQTVREKYPAVDFSNIELLRDVERYLTIMNKIIIFKVDQSACESNKPNFRCFGCNCWKENL
jgi:uncharacterized protein with HEPN domain